MNQTQKSPQLFTDTLPIWSIRRIDMPSSVTTNEAAELFAVEYAKKHDVPVRLIRTDGRHVLFSHNKEAHDDLMRV